MKRTMMIFAVALLAIAIAAPAMAAVEFKYGGQWRTRIESQDNVYDGTSLDGYYNNFSFASTTYNSDDNRNFIDQRLRLYFSFIASKNLKVVTKFEIGDVKWGDSLGANSGRSTGGNVGADGVNVETKNAYVEFNIPNTPTTAIIGIQSLVLLDSWIVDDDFSAGVLVTKLDPFTVTLGYVAGQYGAEKTINNQQLLPYSTQDANVDSMFLSVDWKDGPFKASGVFFWQNAHRSTVSADPTTLTTPASAYTGLSTGFVNQAALDSNNLFDFGFNFTYKVDWLLAYINFVKNFGSVDYVDTYRVAANPGEFLTGVYTKSSHDYTGFMIDAGVTYFCGPWTANIGGFYTTGADISDDSYLNNFGSGDGLRGLKGGADIEWFTYPLATSKYFSEIIGGGVLGDDIYAYRGYGNNAIASQMGQAGGMQSVYWRGYGFPTNLWTITAGGSWQVTETTKLSASYWYFGTSESVPVSISHRYVDLSGNVHTIYNMSSNIGHELNFYVDQKIVDGLTLTLVGAYLFAEDAFCPLPLSANAAGTTDARYFNRSQADDAYELGARLLWNF